NILRQLLERDPWLTSNTPVFLSFWARFASLDSAGASRLGVVDAAESQPAIMQADKSTTMEQRLIPANTLELFCFMMFSW
ncbi:MAG: hypothetical protein K8R46_00265, partial [Pirellulales bacterium]|nr:hypothetical protein [Pirellulales bacterium]